MADLEYHVPETQMRKAMERIWEHVTAIAEVCSIALLALFLVWLVVLFVALLK